MDSKQFSSTNGNFSTWKDVSEDERLGQLYQAYLDRSGRDELYEIVNDLYRQSVIDAITYYRLKELILNTTSNGTLDLAEIDPNDINVETVSSEQLFQVITKFDREAGNLLKRGRLNAAIKRIQSVSGGEALIPPLKERLVRENAIAVGFAPIVADGITFQGTFPEDIEAFQTSLRAGKSTQFSQMSSIGLPPLETIRQVLRLPQETREQRETAEAIYEYFDEKSVINTIKGVGWSIEVNDISDTTGNSEDLWLGVNQIGLASLLTPTLEPGEDVKARMIARVIVDKIILDLENQAVFTNESLRQDLEQELVEYLVTVDNQDQTNRLGIIDLSVNVDNEVYNIDLPNNLPDNIQQEVVETILENLASRTVLDQTETGSTIDALSEVQPGETVDTFGAVGPVGTFNTNNVSLENEIPVANPEVCNQAIDDAGSGPPVDNLFYGWVRNYNTFDVNSCQRAYARSAVFGIVTRYRDYVTSGSPGSPGPPGPSPEDQTRILIYLEGYPGQIADLLQITDSFFGRSQEELEDLYKRLTPLFEGEPISEDGLNDIIRDLRSSPDVNNASVEAGNTSLTVVELPKNPDVIPNNLPTINPTPAPADESIFSGGTGNMQLP